MSNVKEVLISGWMHFNAEPLNEYPNTCDEMKAHHEVRAKALEIIGAFSMPSLGARIRFDGTERHIDNEWGGRTCLVEFTIEGQEALSWGFLQEAYRVLSQVADVKVAHVHDIEADENLDLIEAAKNGSKN